MTREEILQHARDVGLARQCPGQALEVVELARAIERQVREECARQCEDIYSWRGAYSAGPMHSNTTTACAQAIRAMRQK